MAKLRTWALLIFGALAVAYIAVFSPTQAQRADIAESTAAVEPESVKTHYSMPPGT